MTPAYLDTTLTEYLHDGPAGISTPPTFPPDDWVFGPKDYYQWCQVRLPQLVGSGQLPAGTTLDPDNLKDAVRKCGWPTLRELQGKFIVNLFGSDPSGLTSNAISVNLYSHGYGRRIADTKIFPEASVVGSSIINNGNIDIGKINLLSPPSCPSGVCDWNDHTVFAEISGDLQSSDFACIPVSSPPASFLPCNGSQLADPGLSMRNLINDGGIVKSNDGKSQKELADFLNPIPLKQDPMSLGGTAPHGYNSVGAGDAPGNMVVNFRPGDAANPNQVDGPLDWSYGCLWDSHNNLLPGCPTVPLSEQHDAIAVTADGVAGSQLSDSSPLLNQLSDPSRPDNLVFLHLPRAQGSTASLRAFVSTRRGRNADGTPDTVTLTGDDGCLMARADVTDPKAPFFALCRNGHRNGGLAFGNPTSYEGLYVFYRVNRGGPIRFLYPDANPGPTNEAITHQGEWELQPSLRIQPDQAGTCWSGFTRTTDDPSPAPGWGEVNAGPAVCVSEPLNVVGLATDGGREFSLKGQYVFENARYSGQYLTADAKRGTLGLEVSRIGAIGVPTVEDRSAFDNDLDLTDAANVTVEATSPAGATARFAPPTVIDAGDGFPSSAECDHRSGSTFPIGVTTVKCTVTDSDDLQGSVSKSFTVTVRDTNLALANVPANIVVNATSPAGATVGYAAPSSVDPSDATPPPVECKPPSGATFGIGDTTVTCTVNDPDEPAPVSATFNVHVKGVDEQLNDLLAETRGVGLGQSLPAKVQVAINLWRAGLTPAACGTLRSFLFDLDAQEASHFVTTPRAAQIRADATRIRAVIGCT